jgi:ferredoxin
MAFTITVADSGERFPCAEGQNVLAAMLRGGRRDIPVGCRGGGCGICRVQIVGPARYRTLKMSRAQVSVADEAQGIALACKLVPEADLTVKVLGLAARQPQPAAGGTGRRA